MKLNELINGCNCPQIEINSISIDSSNIGPNCLFFCLRGSNFDGHDYAIEAVKNGAVAIVTEIELDIPICQIVVSDTRSAFSIASCNFYNNPAKQLKLVGITGTNGKTTTSYIIKSIIEASGKKCGLIGTNCVIIGDKTYKAELTTPDPLDLNRFFSEMVNAGIEYVVMEVSAHAIYYKKIEGLSFDAVCFTNVSQDHLDFFSSIGDYSETKKKLFKKRYAAAAAVNIDDPIGEQILKEADIPVFTYGCNNPSDAFAIDLKMSSYGIEYVLNLFDDIMNIKFDLSGKFNMYNTLCAATTARILGISNKHIVKGIKAIKRVEGRFNILNFRDFSVIIDYAHTEDGLSNIIRAVREFSKAKIITVFGCGGNRDKKKRPLMGKVASLLSDFCILTSDNPRFENPMDIIDEIEVGIRELGNNNYFKIDDRKAAIRHALKMASLGDIIIIAGKGAESYQDICGHKHPYNDEEYVLEIMGV